MRENVVAYSHFEWTKETGTAQPKQTKAKTTDPFDAFRLKADQI